MAYNWSYSLLPKHMLQFADDTTIVSVHVKDNQKLCNVFTNFCANLHIRVDKCSTRFIPMIKILDQNVPVVEYGKTILYLGKAFNFDLSCEKAKADILKDLADYILKIESVTTLIPKRLK